MKNENNYPEVLEINNAGYRSQFSTSGLFENVDFEHIVDWDPENNRYADEFIGTVRCMNEEVIICDKDGDAMYSDEEIKYLIDNFYRYTMIDSEIFHDLVMIDYIRRKMYGMDKVPFSEEKMEWFFEEYTEEWL